MPNEISKIGLSYRDVKGFSSIFHFFALYDTLPHGFTVMNTVQTAFSGLTNAIANGGTGLGLGAPSSAAYGSSAPFSTIEDKAIFTFLDTAGSIHRWQVPAPKDAIFLADGETVDPANGLVVSFVTAMTTADAGPSFVCSRAGEQINAFAAGIRIRRKIRRRVTIFTLDPSLSGPDE